MFCFHYVFKTTFTLGLHIFIAMYVNFSDSRLLYHKFDNNNNAFICIYTHAVTKGIMNCENVVRLMLLEYGS